MLGPRECANLYKEASIPRGEVRPTSLHNGLKKLGSWGQLDQGPIKLLAYNTGEYVHYLMVGKDFFKRMQEHQPYRKSQYI